MGKSDPETSDRVREGMIPEGMSLLSDFLNEFGIPKSLSPDHKESRFGVIAVQNFEDFWGVDRMWAIINGDPDFLLICFKTSDGDFEEGTVGENGRNKKEDTRENAKNDQELKGLEEDEREDQSEDEQKVDRNKRAKIHDGIMFRGFELERQDNLLKN